MAPRQMYEEIFFFLYVIPTSNIVSYKILKNFQYSMCFYNFVMFWGYTGDQGGKCDQLTQFLKGHGFKRHGLQWGLKQHSA